MRLSLLCIALAAFATAAPAQSVSDRIAAEGLRATAAHLSSLGTPSPSDRLALGGVGFLAAIETALQTRWRFGLDAGGVPLPVLRLFVPPNPGAEPMRPDIIDTLFATLAEDLETARASLLTLSDSDDAALTLNLADLWFDIDSDGTRDGNEGIAGAVNALAAGAMGASDLPTIRFDTADAAWLAAYTHLLQALAEIVQAFDTTAALERTLAAGAEIAELNAGRGGGVFGQAYGGTADTLLTLYLALESEPDPARTRAARRHLLDMIGQNRIFWRRVATETDNDAEWIPNAAQDTALGIDFPPDTGAVWQSVLADAEGLLEGDLLIPHWRLHPSVGINLRRLLEQPAPVRLVEWAHGIGLLPYAEPGTRISPDSWTRFVRMTGGNAGLFMVILN